MDPDLLNFVGVVLTLGSVGIGGYAAIRILNAKLRKLDDRAPGAEILAELDDLRSRVHELEGGRLLELEERIDFAERLLARHSGAAPDALRSVEEQR